MKRFVLRILGIFFIVVIIALFYVKENYLNPSMAYAPKKINNLILTNKIDEKFKTVRKPKPIEVPAYVLDKLISSRSPYKKEDLRKFPYHYKAMLAICSDIDDTTFEEFNKYHQFLNTKADTPHGKGLGLDIGDSMWMFTANNFNPNKDSRQIEYKNAFTYYNGTDKNTKNHADTIKKYYNAGWIDSLHTYGDFSRLNENDVVFNRNLAIDCWTELNKENIKFKIWINHGNTANKQNFGGYNVGKFYQYQEGDNKNSPHYNSDIAIKGGIKFLWNSTGDPEFGCDNPLYEIKLRDGNKLWGFHRYTNDLVNKKIDWTWTPDSLHKQLTKERLDKLIEKQQYSIVAQHFGRGTDDLFAEQNQNALRLLQQYKENESILVARTSRLLSYAVAQNYLRYSIIKDNDLTWINIQGIEDPIFGEIKPGLDDVRGITFYTDNPDKTYILLNSKLSDSKNILRDNSSDKRSIGIKWFRDDTHDYTNDLE